MDKKLLSSPGFLLGFLLGLVIVFLIEGEMAIIHTFEAFLLLGSLWFVKKVIDEFFNWTLERRDRNL